MKTKVLVVDDEIEACRTMETFLRRSDAEVETALSGAEAVERARARRFDIVLLDERMPGLSGLDTLRRIKNIDSDIIVIMLTAIDDSDTVLAAIRAGADDYMIKPVEFIALKRAMELALEKRAVTLDSRDYQKRLETQVSRQMNDLQAMNIALERASLELVRALSGAIEAKDTYTRGHCFRVTAFALALGEAAHITHEGLVRLEFGALLHDIGKIGVREEILGKQGALTPEEFAHVKTHPGLGHDMLRDVSSFTTVCEVVRSHHERFDGAGYPDGLTGEEIPLMARVAAIADVYDALTSDRPYRRPMAREQALSIMNDGRGTQFDPELFDLFIQKKLYLLSEESEL